MPIGPLCRGSGVLDEGGFIARDRLIILSRDDQSRAVIEAAVAQYGGVISPLSSDAAGIYGIEFPPTPAAELDRIRSQLVSVGFDASLSPIDELFAASS